MKKLSFRQWLRDRGLLVEYLRNRLNSLNHSWLEYGTLLEDPSTWINQAFSWKDSPEGFYAWSNTSHQWSSTLSADTITFSMVDPAIPLDDPMGLALLLAELEEENGKKEPEP